MIKKKKIIVSKAAFTLVELLIYSALMTIFMLVLTDIFTTTLRLQTETEASSSAEEDGRFILLRFIHDINAASAITTPATLGATSSTLAITVNSVAFMYRLNSGKLQISKNGG